MSQTRRAPALHVHIGRVVLDAGVQAAAMPALDAAQLGDALRQALAGEPSPVNQRGLAEHIAAAVAEQLTPTQLQAAVAGRRPT
jgi:hypothetical protein